MKERVGIAKILMLFFVISITFSIPSVNGTSEKEIYLEFQNSMSSEQFLENPKKSYVLKLNENINVTLDDTPSSKNSISSEVLNVIHFNEKISVQTQPYEIPPEVYVNYENDKYASLTRITNSEKIKFDGKNLQKVQGK